MSNERDGRNLIAEADKKAQHKGWFGGNKLEEAAELYTKAANCFKVAKKWKEAGDAFMSKATVLNRMNERDEASGAYMDAAKCYKKISPHDAVTCLQQAVEILVEKGRFQAAANNQKQMAEIYETDLVDFEKAMHAYEIAAEWYHGEDSNAQANACMLKVGTFAAQIDQFDKAIEKFEQVATNSMDSQLTRFSLREYFLKAGICYLCTGDYIRARQALERYQNMDATFAPTRECGFLKALLEAVEAQDAQAFTDAVSDWNRLTALDNWKTALLLKVKKSLNDEEVDFT
ncbi:soluble NSF attachment protein [Fimicolochytrium jonesii]|uniref:soluble NSF attachment protein n=1 Tax=Fimicolochytrium jonesii TaxID=1396493 RepID=UPI0022FEDF86|nr:soluble NSF attachment protein [Fimicolochytrium jonesii]KAI8817118.1 soluble NSF attachment protein [Fimicolochytrium jonesii]